MTGDQHLRSDIPPRSRFYDGWFYAKVIDRVLSDLHGFVAAQIKPGEKVVDAGCGTGDLAFLMASKAAEVVGIELSPAMVDYANRRLAGTGLTHVSFVLGDVTKALAHRPDGSFDVATMVMALHEMPQEIRTGVLQELTRLAGRVLCVDFSAPMPWNISGIMNRIFEMAAGTEHFRAFRDFKRRGGMNGIAVSSGLSCRHLRHINAGTMDLSEIRR